MPRASKQQNAFLPFFKENKKGWEHSYRSTKPLRSSKHKKNLSFFFERNVTPTDTLVEENFCFSFRQLRFFSQSFSASFFFLSLSFSSFLRFSLSLPPSPFVHISPFLRLSLVPLSCFNLLIVSLSASLFFSLFLLFSAKISHFPLSALCLLHILAPDILIFPFLLFFYFSTPFSLLTLFL